MRGSSADEHLEEALAVVDSLVEQTPRSTAEEAYLGAPKTKQSQRRIKLGMLTIEALQQHRARQLQERLELGGEWVNHVLVFPNAIGKLRDGMNLLRYHFMPLLRRAGRPTMHFHALRHSAATMLFSRGVNPKIVSAMLRHSSVSVTLEIYSHVPQYMQQQPRQIRWMTRSGIDRSFAKCEA